LAGRLARRAWLAGAGATGLATFAYKAAPAFWKQFSQELQRPIGGAPRIPDWRKWTDRGIHAAWLGHSTVLLRVDGFTMITDPILSDWCGVHVGPVTLGLKRLVAPALQSSELPHIDLLLLSHAHMDHLDIPSVRALEDKGTAVITARSTSDLLRPTRYKSVTEIGWGDRARVGPATVRGVEVRHWGARVRTDTYRGYNAYVIDIGRHRILFGGDTAEIDTFRSVRSSRPVDLAIMPIGAYDPWIHVHCNPEQAWRMGSDAGAEHFLPVHNQTFRLSREPLGEPLERFLEAAGPHPDRVLTRHIGDEARLS
jgi:L-ascorbate metabolism protein UlaG (beta-lactamase superfamily)